MHRTLWRRALALGIAVSVAAPAWAQEPAAPAPESAPAPATPFADHSAQIREIDAAIDRQRERRHGATALFVTGGVVLVGGLVATVIQSVNDANEAEQQAQAKGQSTYETKVNWTGFGVGVLIAAPLFIGGALTIRDVHRQTNILLRERRGLALTPGPGLVNVTYRF